MGALLKTLRHHDEIPMTLAFKERRGKEDVGDMGGDGVEIFCGTKEGTMLRFFVEANLSQKKEEEKEEEVKEQEFKEEGGDEKEGED